MTVDTLKRLQKGDLTLMVRPDIPGLLSDGDPAVAGPTLHKLGFNVTVQLYNPEKKGRGHWKSVQNNRLIENDLCALIAHVFERTDICNLAVITGRLSGYLFILDCESDEELSYHCAELQKRGITLWVSRSNSAKGGGHIWLSCLDGEVTNIRLGKYPGRPELEIRGNRCFILVPPSVHPDGTIYSWLFIEGSAPPLVHLSQLDWLSLTVTRPPRSSHPYTPFSRYSQTTQRFIANPPGPDSHMRNNELFAAACDVIGCDDDPYAVLTQSALRSGLSMDEIRTAIRSAESEVREPSRKDQPGEHLPLPWEHGVAWGLQHTWIGRTATTDRQVWTALCELAKVEYHGVFRATARETAEIARVHGETANNAIQRRIKAGDVCCEGNQENGARLLKFSETVLRTSVRPQTQQSTLKTADINERAALGGNPLIVWQWLLANGPHPSKTIEAGTALSRQQVRTALSNLDAKGREAGQELVVCEVRTLTTIQGGGTVRLLNIWRAIPRDATALDQIAHITGAKANAKKRRERHGAERSKRAFNRILRSIDWWTRKSTADKKQKAA